MENEVKDKKKNKMILKIAIIVIALTIIIGVLTVAVNYMIPKANDKINLIINNSNVTTVLKKDVLVENGIVYVSKEDLANFFDEFIYYNKEERHIYTTYSKNTAVIPVTGKQMILNKEEMPIAGGVIQKDNTYYLPFSEMKKVYNIEINYDKEAKIVTADSIERKKVETSCQKDATIKTSAKFLSRTVDSVKKGDTLIYIEDATDDYVKIRTKSGKIGYVKKDVIGEKKIVRQAIQEKEQIDGKVSLIWDYYSEYASAPKRNGTTIPGINVVSPSFFTLKKLGKGEVKENVGEEGRNYIAWARSNNYKVWAIVSNDSMIDTTSEILNSYELRQKLIDKIVDLVREYELDGINIDFEYMYQKDKDAFSRFLIELEPRLKQLDAILSVDVTAPDGGENWSLCYDRNTIGKVADYIVFMAYDQYGSSDTKAGTTAGYNWVETNIKKFIGQEGVKPEKLVLGMPFFTRVWKEDSTGKATSNTIDMRNIDSKIPNGVEKKWDNDLRQYYMEYQQDNYTYKMWIEDRKSLAEKLDLVAQYQLAGAAFWKKDKESDGVFELISEKLGI